MHASDQPWRIPYGVADFIKLRDRGHYFVDKTGYLPLLEQAGEYLFLIRPRRFGKSLLQSVMECYYDAHWVERFDALFADTWVSEHPTPEKGQYLTLRFDFSAVRSDPGLVEDSFEAYTRIILTGFLKRHATRIPAPLVWEKGPGSIDARIPPCLVAHASTLMVCRCTLSNAPITGRLALSKTKTEPPTSAGWVRRWRVSAAGCMPTC
jgi:hypothetical protein